MCWALLWQKCRGTDFQTALAELVTKPLGMTDTAFYADQSERARMAASYYLDNGKLARMKDDQFLTSVDDRYFHFSPERVFMLRNMRPVVSGWSERHLI